MKKSHRTSQLKPEVLPLSETSGSTVQIQPSCNASSNQIWRNQHNFKKWLLLQSLLGCGALAALPDASFQQMTAARVRTSVPRQAGPALWLIASLKCLTQGSDTLQFWSLLIFRALRSPLKYLLHLATSIYFPKLTEVKYSSLMNYCFAANPFLCPL